MGRIWLRIWVTDQSQMAYIRVMYGKVRVTYYLKMGHRSVSNESHLAYIIIGNQLVIDGLYIVKYRSQISHGCAINQKWIICGCHR